MRARDAIDVLARNRGAAVAVCALGMAANEWWAATKSEDSFYMHGAMGFAASFALGLALSIPLLVFGSALVLALFNRFPVLVWAGAVLLGWIAGNLIGTEPDLAAWLRVQWPSFDTWDGPAGAVCVPVIALLRRRHKAPMRQA